MTIPEMDEVFIYWRNWPPTHEIAAMEAGWKPPEKWTLEAEQAKVPSKTELFALVEAINNRGL